MSRPSHLLRSASYTVLVLGATRVAAQTPLPATPPDTLQAMVRLHAAIQAHGADIGPLIWPGYRPDTIPALYVIPNRGKVLISWRREAPDGMATWPGRSGVLWTDTRNVRYPAGSGIAFNNLVGMNVTQVLGLALHEAFHSYERSSARPGARFGAWENALLTAIYPVFDLENEAQFALESLLLRRALRAANDNAARELARDFLAVRTTRQSRLPRDLVEYEVDAEINEGLAQYALLRGTELLAMRGVIPAAAAAAEVALEEGILDRILEVDTRSVRRRFYATGSALARLLDRVAGDAWKQRLMADTASLPTLLSQAVGFESTGAAARVTSAERAVGGAMRSAAERSIRQLRSQRAAQLDSMLARPGLRVVIDPAVLSDRNFNWCGFDPQNVLQTGTGKLLHTSFLNACAGSDIRAEIQSAVVQDQQNGALELVLDPATVQLFSGNSVLSIPSAGQRLELSAFRLESATLSLRAPRAVVWREATGLRIQPAR